MTDPDQPQPGHATLVACLEACRGREVWIVGDLMLDEYVSGPVDRISPEAPVPVVQVQQLEHRVGGAANVARQVAALGARAVLAGVVGADEAGKQLLDACTREHVDVRAVHVAAGYATTRKLRVLAHGQQLLRLDWEQARPSAPKLVEHLLERLQNGPPPDYVILSDYAKGVLNAEATAALVAAARAAGCGVIVDPKVRDFTTYRGADVLTPNLRELTLASGESLDGRDLEAVGRVARRLAEVAGVDAMLVTLGADGLLLVARDRPSVHLAAHRRAVADVTGAGDTVVAVVGAMLAGGAPLEYAATAANAAAALAVAEVGTVAIGPEQIHAALAERPAGKVLQRAELTTRASTWRRAGKRIVFTNGCFDLIHAGHLALLHEAARHGDVLVVAINSDESVRKLKGPSRPVVTATDRAALLAALACVDAVTIYDEDTPLETLHAVRPQVLVKGEDYSLDDIVGREVVEADGGRVLRIPLVAQKSTSELVERIRRGAPKPAVGGVRTVS